MVIEKDDRVFYQTQNEKAWLGPAKVLNVDKNWVWISGNGDYKKVPKCNVKLSTKKDTVYFEDVEDEKEETVEKMRMRSMTKELQKEKEREESIGTFWMKMEQNESFEDIAVYTVEIPSREHNTPEVKEAKMKEVENLMRYEVFEEVDDCGQEKIGSRWVVTRKEKADGQKAQIKGRLVAKGFLEEEKPQSDSPTMLRESLKMYFAIASNEGFKIRSVDIKTAFLQAKGLEREIYMEPPKDIKKEGKIWKLKKPLYRLNDAS